MGWNGIFQPYYWSNGPSMVWTNVALKAADQLRQRVAWGLSQICVAGFSGSSKASYNEVWHNFYDIFVRHAFGNYRDVLKEVSYSPIMGDYLTYLGNKAFGGYAGGSGFPDENYSREVMQLFSIGLYKLNLDGTREKDPWGEDVPTYGNEAIVNFARVWTGFNLQSTRTNIEQDFGRFASQNYIDPMQIKPSYRDIFPKPGLDGNFLGDGYPVCNQLPSRHAFRVGARYRYTGKVATEQSRCEASGGSSCHRLTPNATTSALHAALCVRPNVGAACSFPSEVFLSSAVPCDGIECEVDQITVGIRTLCRSHYILRRLLHDPIATI